MQRRKISGVVPALLFSGCSLAATVAPPAGEDFETPFEGLSPELNALFLAGDEDFERRFGFADGLGPLYNNDSCGSCHPGDGGGTPQTSLVRFSFGEDPAWSAGGPQLQDKAAPGHDAEVMPEGADWSPRRPPPVFGMGLIEAIDPEEIIALEDAEDIDGDGVSGRINWVTPADWVGYGEVGGGPGPEIGRFGLKANVSSLVEQVVNAYQQDMGITSDYVTAENHASSARGAFDVAADPEVGAHTVTNTVFYVRLLQPPARPERNAAADVGATLFEEIGCADCHVPSLRTTPHEIEALSEREVPLYSDLLLHDMGDELADGRPDGSADGREWRTTPLWGLRLSGAFNAGPFYLHDGRATTVDEAIRLHGGEARAARDGYAELDDDDRDALLQFLETL